MASEPRRPAFGSVLLTLITALALSCESTREEPTGGETHFLQRCDDAPSACGSRFTCLCGVCSVPCSDAVACAELPNASCVTTEGASACSAPSPAQCDVTCNADADCAALSSDHRCVAGRCRTDASGEPACPSGDTAANEVLVIGDSFVAVNHNLTAFLEDLARQSGALAAGERYRDFSSLLGNTLALGGNGLEAQYTAASAESPVRVVIMNGGGADLLLGSCDTLTPDCPLVTDAVAAAEALLSRMADDGVEHVVYAFYPDPVDMDLRAEVDVLRPLIESTCASSPVPCEWLDLRPTFAGNYATYVGPDGNNPTPEGARASAAAIWTTMQQACIAQ
jgi:hypothetical protein